MWESIISTLEQYWLELTSTGFVTVFGLKTFIFDKINANKVNMDFKSMGSNFKDDFTKLFNAMDLVFEKVEKLNGVVDNLTKENALKDEQVNALSDLVVQTLSVANLPLEQKAIFYENLNKVAIVSDNTKTILKSIVAREEKAIAVDNQINEELDGKLNEV